MKLYLLLLLHCMILNVLYRFYHESLFKCRHLQIIMFCFQNFVIGLEGGILGSFSSRLIWISFVFLPLIKFSISFTFTLPLNFFVSFQFLWFEPKKLFQLFYIFDFDLTGSLSRMSLMTLVLTFSSVGITGIFSFLFFYVIISYIRIFFYVII